MANPINDPNVKFPISEVPPTLQPIKRGAVIDWKATALAEHDARWAHQIQSSHRQRLVADQQKEIATLTDAVTRQDILLKEHQHVLKAIRAHWSAFLLPRLLR